MANDSRQAVMALLINEDRPWAVEELVREMGDRLDALDAIADLHGFGLINRIGPEYVCASRAALRAHAIEQEDVPNENGGE
jgi:hypothetical protein